MKYNFEKNTQSNQKRFYFVAEILRRRIPERVLDIGCGDGVGSSLLMGWRFAAESDVYHDLDLEAVDIYDSVPQNEAPVTIATLSSNLIVIVFSKIFF